MTFKLTFLPCWCKAYKFGVIKDIEHTFGDAAVEFSISLPQCTGDGNGCLLVDKFTYFATKEDGTALPNSIEF